MSKIKKEEDTIFWYNYNLADEKDFKTAVKNIQKMCRMSLEYDKWQTLTKIKQNLTFCPICNESYDFSKPETHHYPKTMFDVCFETLESHLFANDFNSLSGFGLCEEIMNKHFMGLVDNVVLCKACHERFHAGHPEVCNKVDKYFLDTMNNQPTTNMNNIEPEIQENINTEQNINKSKVESTNNECINNSLIFNNINMDIPPAPKINIDEYNNVTFINKNGIEIDIN